jgi:hypothetical protein
LALVLDVCLGSNSQPAVAQAPPLDKEKIGQEVIEALQIEGKANVMIQDRLRPQTANQPYY